MKNRLATFKQINRSWFFISSALLFAICYSGYTWYRIHEAHSLSARDMDHQYMQGIRDEYPISQQIHAAIHLRSKYRKWAVLHSDILSTMMHGGKDLQPMNAVWKALPGIPEFPKYTPGDKFVSFMNHGRLDGFQFSWNPVSNIPEYRQTASGAVVPVSKDVTNRGWFKFMKKQYLEYHDIDIADTVVPGGQNVHLWASGRITEDTTHSLQKGNTVRAISKEVVIKKSFSFIP